MAVLTFSSKQKNLAYKCLAVADACGVAVDAVENEACSKISFTEGPPLTLTDSSSICTYLSNSREDCLERQAKTIQWTSFVNSEISPYPPNSKQILHSLQYIEYSLTTEGSLSNGNFCFDDIIVGFPLLQLPVQVTSKFPKIQSWLENVKLNTQPWSSRLQQMLLVNSKEDLKVKKDTKKNTENRKEKQKPEKKRKLRVLCIHGYRQSAKTSKEKLGSFRKLVGKFADLDFVTAPHLIPSENPDEQEQYGWWFSKANQSFDAHEETDCDLGFDESIKLIEDTLKKQAASGLAYDGIFSFSQGASLAAHLCVLQQIGKLDAEFRFCVLVAGFVSRTLNHKGLFEKMLKDDHMKVTIPTLHVLGDTDRVIEKEMSEDLLQYFTNTDELRHAGGHFVPATGEEKKTFVSFFEKMQNTLVE